jgi:uncharacterized protein
MVLPDVNVLVYAHREDAPDHERYRVWVEELVNGSEPYGLADLVLSGFIRVLTHPRVFSPPSPPQLALAFAEQLRSAPNCVRAAPGERHWEIFVRLCREAGAKGNLVPDAYLAALAIESGSEWITTDRGFARYPGLRWRHPLE